jgi:hypothetical protein
MAPQDRRREVVEATDLFRRLARCYARMVDPVPGRQQLIETLPAYCWLTHVETIRADAEAPLGLTQL